MFHLLSNVPLEETIQLITKSIYDLKYQNGKKLIIARDIFIKILCMATQKTFVNKNKLYQQYDKVSMGSPLESTIANFFLENVENHPKLYLKYADDIFCVFNNKAFSDKFLDLLNKQLKSNKFIVEHGSETLSCLDVEVAITEFGIET